MTELMDILGFVGFAVTLFFIGITTWSMAKHGIFETIKRIWRIKD